MKNKTVIRKKTENGKFTTIHNSILFDTRLTPNAFRLMTAILSDSDTNFNLSQTLYCKRLKIAKQTFFKAIAKLEECGYLKKTPTDIKNFNFYTLSEYGNLGDKTTSADADALQATENNASTEIITNSNTEIKVMPDEYYDRLRPFYNKYNDLMCDDFYYKVFEVDLNKGEDYEIIIEKFEKYLYKKVIASVTDSNVNPKSFEEFKFRAKELIFKHKKYDANFMNTWTIYKLTRNKKQAPRDYETEMFDYYENPED
jgi:hypothetical protein